MFCPVCPHKILENEITEFKIKAKQRINDFSQNWW